MSLLSAASWIYGFQLPLNNPLQNNNSDCLARMQLCRGSIPPPFYKCVPLHIATWINCPRSVTKTLAAWYPDPCLAVDSFRQYPFAANCSTLELCGRLCRRFRLSGRRRRRLWNTPKKTNPSYKFYFRQIPVRHRYPIRRNGRLPLALCSSGGW